MGLVIAFSAGKRGVAGDVYIEHVCFIFSLASAALISMTMRTYETFPRRLFERSR